MNEIDYGPLNGPILGMILKEVMRRAMGVIHSRRARAIMVDKDNPDKPGGNDKVSDIDIDTQALIVKKLIECFPQYGIVAEELGLSRKCTIPNGVKLFFTADPLDGTKALDRRQSHGFGPMISLCTDTEVIAAFVGDVMSGEIFYYRPGSEKVHRLNIFDDQHEQLVIDVDRPLSKQYMLLRDNPQKFPAPYRQIVEPVKFGGLFHEMEIMGGGIGVGMARLWKGEVGAYALLPGLYTPWDLWPVWGLSKKLGFIWMKCARPNYSDVQGSWGEWKLVPSETKLEFDKPTIVIHESRREEFLEFASKIIIPLPF